MIYLSSLKLYLSRIRGLTSVFPPRRTAWRSQEDLHSEILPSEIPRSGRGRLRKDSFGSAQLDNYTASRISFLYINQAYIFSLWKYVFPDTRSAFRLLFSRGYMMTESLRPPFRSLLLGFLGAGEEGIGIDMAPPLKRRDILVFLRLWCRIQECLTSRDKVERRSHRAVWKKQTSDKPSPSFSSLRPEFWSVASVQGWRILPDNQWFEHMVNRNRLSFYTRGQTSDVSFPRPASLGRCSSGSWNL